MLCTKKRGQSPGSDQDPLPLQLRPQPCQSRFHFPRDRRARDAPLPGDLRHGEPFQVVPNEQVPGVVIKLRQGFIHIRRHLAPGLIVVSLVIQVRPFPLPAGGIAANQVHGLARGDTMQPAGKGAADLPGPFHQLEKRLLRRIGRPVRIRQNPQARTVDQPGVLADDLGKRLGIPGADKPLQQGTLILNHHRSPEHRLRNGITTVC